MSIEVLRLLADKFEECGIRCVDSHKLGELISDMDDNLNPKVFRPLMFEQFMEGADFVDGKQENFWVNVGMSITKVPISDFGETWNKHKGVILVQEKEISQNNETEDLCKPAD